MGIVDEFFELKEETDADLLAMQVGDFYEFFSDDAHTVGDALGLKVSQKSSHGSSYAMAGVPIEDLEKYINTLVESKGYTVAVADQYEEDGSHERRIVRKVTPGTILESVEGDSRYLAAVFVCDDDSVGLSFTDISSGQILMKNSNIEDYLNDISVYRPVEVLVSTSGVETEKYEQIEEEIGNYMNTRIEHHSRSVEEDNLVDLVCNQFGSDILDSIGIESDEPSVCSTGIIIEYLQEAIPQVQNSISKLTEVGNEKYVHMDARTRRSLELVDTISNETGESLFDVIDKTVTSSGRDKLRRYLQRPISSKERIESRQECVSALVRSAVTRQKIRGILSTFPNMRRISSRASYGSARPHELSKIVNGIESFRELKRTVLSDSILEETEIGSMIQGVSEDEVQNMEIMIDSALVEDPPNKVEEGVISKGYDDELDRIIESYRENEKWFSSLEKEVKHEYDITHVSIDRNKTDGYYVQVGKSESEEISRKEYDEIKQLKNSKRFKNDDIRERERKFLRLEERRENKEKEIFEELLNEVSENSELLQEIGGTVARVDSMLSLATHAV